MLREGRFSASRGISNWEAIAPGNSDGDGGSDGGGGDGRQRVAVVVQQICGEMEKMFQADAAKDADRLRALIDKRKAIAAAAQARQATASRQLQRTLSSCKPCGHSSSN